MSYGFIITRHVNSEMTNQYWNHCVQCIQRFYSPDKYKIVIIDDNSNTTFLKGDYDYKNVEYVQSQFPGRGELLPYYYFFKNRYFDNAVIIHDSVFFNKKINFSKILAPVLPLWHFSETKTENLPNTMRLSYYLKNNHNILKSITGSYNYEILSFNKKVWCGCFGVQSYINLDFLTQIQQKYNVFNLLGVVKNRTDRCCLERIIGSIFFNELQELYKIKSLLGDIRTYCNWGYSWDNYKEDIKNKKRPTRPLIKIWTGR